MYFHFSILSFVLRIKSGLMKNRPICGSFFLILIELSKWIKKRK